MKAGRAEYPPELSPPDREERILALKELHAIGILDHDAFVAEMSCVTDPQPTVDPTPRTSFIGALLATFAHVLQPERPRRRPRHLLSRGHPHPYQTHTRRGVLEPADGGER
jgi:hypothetical protein